MFRARKKSHAPIRVAYICGVTHGATWMVGILAGLRARGYDVIAIIGGADGGTATALREAGVPYIAMRQDLRRTSRVAAMVRAVPRLRSLCLPLDAVALLRTVVRMARVLRRLEVDVVHTQLFNSILLGRLAGALARVPLRVAMIPAPYHLETRWLSLVDLLTQWLDHRLIAGSITVDDLYARMGVPARRRCVVGYGPDAERFDPGRADPERLRHGFGVPDDAPLIGQVAMFYPVADGGLVPPLAQGRGIKGHEDFVRAARLVLDKRPDARFLLVGGGWGPEGEQHRQEIQRLSEELGVNDAVIFTGIRLDVPDILAALDVSVQCSLSEGYGGTVESLLMRAPTIATRVGGMPETVRNEETGLLVAPRDPETLAAAMLRLIEDPDLGRRLGEAGRALMLDRYTIQHAVRGVDAVYRELAWSGRLARRPPVGC